MPAIDFSQAVTNKCPGWPRIAAIRECSISGSWSASWTFARHQLDIPADEMRLRNYIRPEEFPYTTPNGCVLRLWQLSQNAASGQGTDWLGELEKRDRRAARAEGTVDGHRNRHHAGFRNEQFWPVADRQSPMRRFSRKFPRAQICKLDIYGEVVVAVGSCPQGQGHETTAGASRLPMCLTSTRISLRCARDLTPNATCITGASGTYRQPICGFWPVLPCTARLKKLKTEMKRLAAFLLENQSGKS